MFLWFLVCLRASWKSWHNYFMSLTFNLISAFNVGGLRRRVDLQVPRFNIRWSLCRGYYKCSNMRGCPAIKHVEDAWRSLQCWLSTTKENITIQDCHHNQQIRETCGHQAFGCPDCSCTHHVALVQAWGTGERASGEKKKKRSWILNRIRSGSIHSCCHDFRIRWAVMIFILVAIVVILFTCLI